MSKSLLFVTSRLPYPATSGRKVSLYHYCRGLAARGFEVSLFVFPEWDQRVEPAERPDFIREVRFAHPVGKGEKLRNLLIRSLFGKHRWPLQCALYYSRRNAAAIAAFAEELGADTVLFDMIRTAPYMDALSSRGVRKILDLDDLLSLRYRRQLEAGLGDVSIAGRYAGGMSTFADRLLCRGPVGRAVLRAEQKRLVVAERFYARQADGVILVSHTEADALNRVLGEEKAIAVPMGVDAAAFDQARRAKKSPGVVGFVGNLEVAANVASLDSIVREILPRMKAECHLEVIGPYTEEVAKRYEKCPNVSLLGIVDSIASVAGRWQLMLAPVAFGSGIKTKVLEGMAMGLPVVTNALGAEGIDAQNGQDWLVAEGADALAEATDRLLCDPALCESIGDAAGAFVKMRFGWDEIFKEFEKLGL